MEQGICVDIDITFAIAALLLLLLLLAGRKIETVDDVFAALQVDMLKQHLTQLLQMLISLSK